MNIKHISLAISAVAIASLIAGCAKNQIDDSINNTGSADLDGQLVDLELASVSSTGTKAVIEGTDFPQTGEIGLFLFKDEMATQDYGTGYENIKYSYNSTNGKWTASPSIKVGSTPGYLYGYYPYDSRDTDVKAIPVSSSLNGDDVMYASKQSSPITDKTASQTTITMNHALARVSITVKNNGYTGEAKLSQIKLEGAKLAASGTLNALDGKITATKTDEVALSVPAAEQPIATGDGTTYECLLVPSGVETNRQAVNLTLTIDGQDKSATLSGDNGVIFAQGTQSNITITLSNTGIAASSVSIDDWKEVEVVGYKVTVGLADDTPASDVLFSVYADGKAAIIGAFSKTGKSLACIVDGKATGKTKTDNIYNFTVSDITSDIIATVGYQHVTGISLDKSELSLYPNESYTLTATVEPSDALNRIVSWSSSLESVATVDENGRITAKAPGAAVITATTEDGGYTTNCSVSVSSNPDGTVPGLFRVSADKRVFFSCGNLVATIDATGTPTAWNFAAHQYDFVGSDGANKTISTAAGDVDLFYWSITNDGTISTDNYGIAITTKETINWNYSGDFYDWGEMVGDGDTWRTLSEDEWVYLLDTRTVCGGTKEGKSYQRATINLDGTGVYGLILYPDDYTSQTDATSFSGTEWAAMEKAGCVFLPAAGFRYSNSVHSVKDMGVYSSSTSGGYDNNLKQFFTKQMEFSKIDPAEMVSASRSMGRSVRLVTDVE